MIVVLAVVAGGLVGAPLRYHVDRLVQRAHGTVFPWGTLVVNVAGSLLLGFLLRALSDAVIGPTTMALIGTGFCGALTTYSTFGYETMRLVGDGDRFHAVANAVVSVVGGLGAALIGWSLAAAVFG